MSGPHSFASISSVNLPALRLRSGPLFDVSPRSPTSLPASWLLLFFVYRLSRWVVFLTSKGFHEVYVFAFFKLNHFAMFHVWTCNDKSRIVYLHSTYELVMISHSLFIYFPRMNLCICMNLTHFYRWIFLALVFQVSKFFYIKNLLIH